MAKKKFCKPLPAVEKKTLLANLGSHSLDTKMQFQLSNQVSLRITIQRLNSKSQTAACWSCGISADQIKSASPEKFFKTKLLFLQISLEDLSLDAAMVGWKKFKRTHQISLSEYKNLFRLNFFRVFLNLETWQIETLHDSKKCAGSSWDSNYGGRHFF